MIKSRVWLAASATMDGTPQAFFQLHVLWTEP